MIRLLAFIMAMVFFSACTASSAGRDALGSKPDVVAAGGPGGFPQIPLPTAKATSTT
jgi:hypothetical protein